MTRAVAYVGRVVLVAAVVSACASPSNGPRGETRGAGPEDHPTSSPVPVSESTVDDSAARLVAVKYRSDPVDIAHPRFEYLDTAGSSFVGGAWYDDEEDYMVILLQDTYYHYCGMDESTWASLAGASSFGTFYNSSIQGRFDCRQGGVPEYTGV